jgi:fumarate hydratase subunit alpha
VVDSGAIAAAVAEGIGVAATTLRPDVRAAVERALRDERDERARAVLAQILRNAEIAAADGVPVCQDTGSVWVSISLGSDERLGSDLYSAIDEAVADTYASRSLRASICADALHDRSNTGDNTPAFVDVSLRPGAGATVDVMLKGGGSDNASALAMLPPAAGAAGVRNFVLDVVGSRGAGACPPLVIGVGVGSTFDKVAGLSKRALLREVGSPPPDARSALLEAELLEAVNATGIGPGGLGGDTTALAVHVLSAPCHIASLPVAVNLGCCAIRSARVELA